MPRPTEKDNKYGEWASRRRRFTDKPEKDSPNGPSKDTDAVEQKKLPADGETAVEPTEA